MSTGTGIEWTEATWNPVVGCTRVHAGCDHCYAVTMTHRLAEMGQAKYAGLTVLNPEGDRHFNGVVRCVPEAMPIPLGWKKPRRVFVNSMSDLFHKSVPFEFIDKVFAVMALCPQHTFQVLTKRPERMAEYLNTGGGEGKTRDLQVIANTLLFTRPLGWERWLGVWPLPNVWLGTSPCDQPTAADSIPHLLRCPAAVRCLSCEPLIGPIDFSKEWDRPSGHGSATLLGDLDWVIVGGESGPNARPCDVAWIRSIIAQCKVAGVPCFVKQLGAFPAAVWCGGGSWCRGRG